MEYLKISKVLKNDENYFYKLIDDIYLLTEEISKDYSNYYNWFYNITLKGIINMKREIIIAMDSNDIAGIIILKKEIDEKKICTLYIKENYRKRGIATKLLEISFEFLGTSNPLITLNKDKYFMFKKIIEKYNWKLSKVLVDPYNKGKIEYIFNK